MFRYIKKLIKHIRARLLFLYILRFPLGEKTYFIGTPEYTNLGDSAIAIAQMLFLRKCGYKIKCIKEFTQSEYTNSSALIQQNISKNHLICGIGGGNLGNQWYNEELFRYSFIDAFPNNPMLIFPQTVFFTDDDEGKKAKEESKKHYEAHNNLTIVAREKKSLELLNQIYHKPKKLLTPDIVLSTTIEDYGVAVRNRSGGLLVFRNDSEQAMTDEDRNKITKYLNENGLLFRITDMYSDEPVTKENRIEVVRKKLQEFADAEFVITDRLHGMVFAALAGTPCIVFSNNHHKVKGTYDWISYLPYIKYVDNVGEAILCLPKLLAMKDCKYDNEPLLPYFDLLAREIKKYVN